MNARTDLAEPRYPWDHQLPDTGTTLELAPGVAWLRMPLPFALDHINLWLLRDQAEDGTDGWAIVDAGVNSPATQAAWEQLFATCLQGLPVLRVLITHMHPDHIGLAGWLCERWHTLQRECRLWISATDWTAARLARVELGAFGGERAATFYAGHGVKDAPWLTMLRERPNLFSRMVSPLPPRFRRLMDGQRIVIGSHEWFAIAGYGHAPEHIALHCPALKVLIAGDMVLPRISTNVSVTDLEPEDDPLGLYLHSLAVIAQRVPADTLVLPSHGKPFIGLHPRIAALTQHHADRLAEVIQACTEAPCSATDLLPVLFPRSLDAEQTGFALSETIAHTNHLWHQGRLQRQLGADGVLRFSVRSAR